MTATLDGIVGYEKKFRVSNAKLCRANRSKFSELHDRNVRIVQTTKVS